MVFNLAMTSSKGLHYSLIALTVVLLYLFEATATCSHVIQHCCIGRCHNGNFTDMWLHESMIAAAENLNREKSLEESLQKLLMALHKSAGEFGCVLGFSGDSIMAENRVAIICQLMAMGYRAPSCFPALGHVGWYVGESNVKLCESMVNVANLELPGAQHCPQISLPWVDILGYLHQGFDHRLPGYVRILRNGTLLMNWGAHTNTRAELREVLHSIALLSDVFIMSGTRVIWKESMAQHFCSPTGVWNGKASKHCCPVSYSVGANWRNIYVDKSMDLMEFPRLPIIKTFNQSLPMHWLHAGLDCTHYCYAAGMFTHVWRQLARHIKRPYAGVPSRRSVENMKKYLAHTQPAKEDDVNWMVRIGYSDEAP